MMDRCPSCYHEMSNHAACLSMTQVGFELRCKVCDKVCDVAGMRLKEL